MNSCWRSRGWKKSSWGRVTNLVEMVAFTTVLVLLSLGWTGWVVGWLQWGATTTTNLSRQQSTTASEVALRGGWFRDWGSPTLCASNIGWETEEEEATSCDASPAADSIWNAISTVLLRVSSLGASCWRCWWKIICQSTGLCGAAKCPDSFATQALYVVGGSSVPHCLSCEWA